MPGSLFSRIVTIRTARQISMHIVAIAWLYVVLMMSITEQSVIAGMMTFLLYGVLPLTIILYLMDAPRRKRNRAAAEESGASSPPVSRQNQAEP